MAQSPLMVQRRKNRIPPLRYPLTLEMQYAAKLKAIVNELERAALNDLKIIGPMIMADIAAEKNQRVDAWYSVLTNFLLRIADKIAQRLLEGLDSVQPLSRQINAKNLSDWRKQVRAAYGVDILRGEPQLAGLLSAWEQENLALIKSIHERIIEQMRGEMVRAFTQGASMKDLAQIVRDRAGVGRSRSELIARDQIGRLNGQLAEMRQRSVGIDEYIWRTSQDERVRPTHRVRNGKKYKWSDPGIKPGSEIRCLPGNSMVDFSNGCRRLFRHWHAGQATRLWMENGLVFQATPNHPMLTSRGWLPINLIQEGDYIIHSVIDGIFVSKNHNNGAVSRIDDAFKTLAQFGRRDVAFGSPADFHGDGTETQIDIIDFNRLLSGYEVSRILQSGSQFGFSESNNSAFSSRAPQQEFVTSFFASGSDVGGSVQSLSFFGAETFPPDAHSAASVALYGASVFNRSNNNLSRNSEFFGQSLYAGTIDMPSNNIGFGQSNNSIAGGTPLSGGSVQPPSAEEFADMVRVAAENGGGFLDSLPFPYKALRAVKKDIGVFVGHVYNLETDIGWYLADSLVTHNCRCNAEPVFPDFKELK